MSQQLQKLLKIWEVAERLNASPSFVYAAIGDGSLKHYRLGNGQGGLRVSEEQLQEYLRRKEEGGEQSPASLRDIRHPSELS
jgi:excisionase family DNA binding protein